MPLPGRKRLDASVFKLLANASSSDGEMEARGALLEYWAEHPWNWLTGTDLDGRPLIWTTDPKDEDRRVKSWPDYEYLRRTVEVLFKEKKVLIDKARQMIVSTVCLLVADWFCKFRPGEGVLVSKVQEGEAIQIINDKIRVVHSRLPLWVREALPQSSTPQSYISYPHPEAESYIQAVAENAATTAMRGRMASIVMVDEAAFQDEFPKIMAAALPMANRIWAVTTANHGSPGARLFHAYISERSPEELAAPVEEKEDE